MLTHVQAVRTQRRFPSRGERDAGRAELGLVADRLRERHRVRRAMAMSEGIGEDFVGRRAELALRRGREGGPGEHVIDVSRLHLGGELRAEHIDNVQADEAFVALVQGRTERNAIVLGELASEPSLGNCPDGRPLGGKRTGNVPLWRTYQASSSCIGRKALLLLVFARALAGD